MTPLSKDKENKYNKFWLYISFLVIAILLGYVFTLLYNSDEAVDGNVNGNGSGNEVEAPVSDNEIIDNGNDGEFKGPTTYPPGT